MSNYYFTVILLLLNIQFVKSKEINAFIFDSTIIKTIVTPSNLSVSNLFISENEPVNTAIGIISADSSNPNETFTYYLTDPINDSDPDKYDNGRFTVVNNELQSAQTFDFETKSEYFIKLGVRNQFGEKIESEFTVTIEDVAIEDLVTIEINDTTLNEVRYYQESFASPTRLVFTNLTTVNGVIDFYENINLVEVEFPQLTSVLKVDQYDSIGGSLYFRRNTNLVKIDLPLLQNTDNQISFSNNIILETINAPNLQIVYKALTITSNEFLSELNICNLKEIIELEDRIDLDPIPTYNISNNNEVIDANPQCFSLGNPENLSVSNLSIEENKEANTIIGLLSADSNYTDGYITYYLTDPINDPDPEKYDNEKFIIVNNELQSKQTFDFEIENEFLIKLGAKNQLGETIETEFTVTVEDVAIEDLVTIEINDTTLNEVRYYQESFASPTRLVFTNLTTVNGVIDFYENINLVEVEFPQLTSVLKVDQYDSIGGSLYFRRNTNLVKIDLPLLQNTDNQISFSNNIILETINTPNLQIVYKALTITSNELLSELNICNLKEIIELEDRIDLDPIPTYNISNNNEVIDSNPQCFSLGNPENLSVSNLSIEENKEANTIIGLLSADSNYTDGYIIYYLTDPINDPDPEKYDNEKFIIVNNELQSKQTFDFEIENEFLVKLGAKNQLGETIETEFTVTVKDVAIEDLVTIEINDTTLDEIRYFRESFTSPTRLVFTNLTTVNGFIDFYENINLVEVEFPKLINTVKNDPLDFIESYISLSRNTNLEKVDFPLLENADGYFSITNNINLELVNAPELISINNYLNVSRNTKLLELHICSLAEISPSIKPLDPEPYFYIENNQNLDFSTTCLTDTNIAFNRVPEIIIQPAPNTIIGSFVNDAGPDANIRYYFVDGEGNETANEDFTIFGDKVYLAKEYDEYTETDFTLEVNADRLIILGLTDRNNNRPPSINEKIELTFTVNIENATLSVDTISSEKQITLFPNPAKNYIRINSKIIFESIKVYDLTGKYIKRLNANENKYNTEAISAGLYILELKEKNNLNTYYKKLVIK